MTDIQVPWGSGEMSITIPEHWELQQVASPALPSAPENWSERLAVALHKPVSGPPLDRLLAGLKGGRIAIIVEDLTRHSPLDKILQVVLREIRHAGFANEQMEIVFASGMHPPMTSQEAREKLGPAAEDISRRSNPWDNPDAYVSLGRFGRLEICMDRGVVEADLRIIISSVSPHLQAGFGGGYKMLFPGCGLLRDIRLLHRIGIRRRRGGQLVGTDARNNPMRRTIDAAGVMADKNHGVTFAVQYLLDAENQPAFLAAGPPTPTHRMLTKQCATSCGIIPTRPADVLITNAYPRDRDLWQAFKCIPNTCWAARPNGVLICLARCEAGLNEMKTMRWPLSPTWTRRIVRLLGPEVICAMMDRIVTRLAGDSQWFIRLATQILQRNPIFMVSPRLVEQNVKFPGIALFGEVDEAITAAGKLLGGGSQRVSIWPWGGASYPYPQEDTTTGG